MSSRRYTHVKYGLTKENKRKKTVEFSFDIRMCSYQNKVDFIFEMFSYLYTLADRGHGMCVYWKPKKRPKEAIFLRITKK